MHIGVMKYAELMDAKDRADLKKAESRIEEGRAIKRRVQGRLRARAYRLNAKNK